MKPEASEMLFLPGFQGYASEFVSGLPASGSKRSDMLRCWTCQELDECERLNQKGRVNARPERRLK